MQYILYEYFHKQMLCLLLETNMQYILYEYFHKQRSAVATNFSKPAWIIILQSVFVHLRTSMKYIGKPQSLQSNLFDIKKSKPTHFRIPWQYVRQQYILQPD
jgi:hypothetical protein